MGVEATGFFGSFAPVTDPLRVGGPPSSEVAFTTGSDLDVEGRESLGGLIIFTGAFLGGDTGDGLFSREVPCCSGLDVGVEVTGSLGGLIIFTGVFRG